MYNICVLRHNKIVMFLAYIIGYFFSLICPCIICSKRKYEKKNKSKKNQNAFKYDCKYVSRTCRSYRMYLEGESLHQAVMIVCECIWFSHISNHHNMRHLCTLAIFSHTTRKILCYFWYMYRYNVIWPSKGILMLIYAY